jgi:uncharacterized membrane protein
MLPLVFRLLIFTTIVVVIIVLIKSTKSNSKTKSKKKAIMNFNSRKSIADELLKLQNLKEEGIISEDDFEKLKEKLIED